MGIFFSKLYSLISKKRDVRLLMVGLDAAGKTTILSQIRYGETTPTIPTIGFNCGEATYKNLSFFFWDLGGQDQIRALWKHYYTNNDAIIFVVDSDDRERMNVAREELWKLLNEEELRDCELLVYANKQDMQGAMTTQEVVRELDLGCCKGRKWKVQGTVATIGDGLFQGLDWLAGVLLKKKPRRKL